MCVQELGLSFVESEEFKNFKRDLCNKDLLINRGLVCQALNAFLENNNDSIKCLDAISSCGLMGMLWRKYVDEGIMIDISGPFNKSTDVINANLKKNGLQSNVIKGDPCNVMRMKSYDFIFLNCRTEASKYFDSAFTRVNSKGMIIVTTSEDSSQCWQSPEVALRNYGGIIVRTPYYRELGIRLVIAEMARAAARYSKGITVLCTASFKSQQSFTIMVKIEKGSKNAIHSLNLIKELLHCGVCGDRAFLPNSMFPKEPIESYLSCKCSKSENVKSVYKLGPVWSGDIFCSDFISSMTTCRKIFPWNQRLLYLLNHILEEAVCGSGNQRSEETERKKFKLESEYNNYSFCNLPSVNRQPCFYFSTHKQHIQKHRIKKVSSIIKLLQSCGFRASRTHFDPEAIRTNATLSDFLKLSGEDSTNCATRQMKALHLAQSFTTCLEIQCTTDESMQQILSEK